MSPRAAAVRDEDYRRLLAFRTELRDFLRWSEEAAHEAGLTPALHQLLLAVRGHTGGSEPGESGPRGSGPRGSGPTGLGPTIGETAERLHIRHHSAVELAQRAEDAGLLARARDTSDHRRVHLRLTPRGRARLEALTREHLARIQALAGALDAVVGRDAPAGARPRRPKR